MLATDDIKKYRYGALGCSDPAFGSASAGAEFDCWGAEGAADSPADRVGAEEPVGETREALVVAGTVADADPAVGVDDPDTCGLLVGGLLAVEAAGGVDVGDTGVRSVGPPPPAASTMDPMVVPSERPPPTRAAIGWCPISSTAVTTPMAIRNTAAPAAATLGQRGRRHPAGLRRGSRWAGRGGLSPVLSGRFPGDSRRRASWLPARRSWALVRRSDSL